MNDLNPLSNAKLRNILQTFDENVFQGSKSALKVYRDFDKDHDGYVSTKDFRSKLVEMNFLTKGEIDLLINYTDNNNKGFLDFTEFNQKMRKNMINNDVSGKIVVIGQ